MNRSLILRTARSSDGISRVELAAQTGLSKPTVNKIVADLLANGVLQEVPQDGERRTRRAGPRPTLVAFRPELGYVIGADIGANKILVLLADLSGRVLSRHRISTHPPLRAGSVLSALRRSVGRVIGEANVARSSIAAVAIGTPGVLDPDTRRVALAPQIPNWEDVDLAASVQEWLSAPVLVDTEIQLSLLAERWLGTGRGTDDLVYVNAGIGIAAGILLGGERYRGATGAAGEIGYLPITDGEEVPSDRVGFGRFELSAGGLAYARLGARAARTRDGALLLELAGGEPEKVDAEIVFRACGMGDPSALAIVELLAGRLARGIAAVAAVVDPALIVLGGGLSRAGELLRGPVERELRSLLPRPPRLVLSELGEEGVALGAVTAAIVEWETATFGEPGRGVHPAGRAVGAATLLPAKAKLRTPVGGTEPVNPTRRPTT